MSAPAANQNIQPNSNESITDIHMLLPKCLATVGTDAKSVELRVTFDAPTSQTTFQYSLVWEDGRHGAEEKYRVSITEANKMMLALKAKKLNRYLGNNREKKNETASGENLENEDQGLPFPPDLRTHSHQSEKSQETSCSFSQSLDSTPMKQSSTSGCSDSDRSRKMSQKSSKGRPLKLESLGSVNENEKVSVKVVVIEKPNTRGKLRPISHIETTMKTQLKTILTNVLREHYEGVPIERMSSYNILFAYRDNKNAQKLRRIRKADVDSMKMNHFPTLYGSVVIVMDLINYVERGKKIPIRIDLDED